MGSHNFARDFNGYQDGKLTVYSLYFSAMPLPTRLRTVHTNPIQYEVSTVPQQDMLLLMGDINAKVGSDNSKGEDAMGKNGCGCNI